MSNIMINFKQIRNFSNRRKLFSIPVTKYASISYQARTLKTDLLQFNIKLF